MTATEQKVPRHPATFSKPILNAIRQELVAWVEDHGPIRVLDPFAGVGKVHDLRDAGGVDTVGVELQPEWAAAHPDTRVGDAFRLVEMFAPGQVGGIVTSPCYGNRMADSHDAKEVCKPCGGTGCADLLDRVPCKPCEGTGQRNHVRNTYTHCLRASGAEPVAGSAVTMQWGPAYRAFHECAVDQWVAVLPEGAPIIVNMSNHLRDGIEQRVVEWWTNLLLVKGCRLDHVRRIGTRRNRHGANRELRVDGEVLIVVHSPSPRWR